MLAIPDSAVLYILFQRTAYLIYYNTSWINKIVIRIPFLSYNRMVRLEARLFHSRIKRLFSEDMAREYAIIKASLPSASRAILDIGCGVAGIDIMLHKHYEAAGRFPELYLLDKSELNDRVYYGIEKTAAYYNSLDIAIALLAANGVEHSRIHTQEVTGASIFPGMTFDLIISLISWGFHYPVSTYLDQAHGLLGSGGRLIIDVRKGSDGEALIKEKFGSFQVLTEVQKYRRILAIKK